MQTKDLALHYVDVGAANNTREIAWFDRTWPLMVSQFEPNPLAAADLRQVERPKSERFAVYETALGSRNETSLLHICRKPELSSFLIPNKSFTDRFPESDRFLVEKSIPVEVRSLDNLTLDFGIVDFMRIDTQGTELEVLKGALRALDTCVAIQVEVEFVPIYQGQCLFGDVSGFLQDFGFELWDFTTLYRYGRHQLDRTGQLAFADALFFRPPEALLAGSDAVRKLVMLRRIAQVFRKTDVSLLCERLIRELGPK